MKSATSLTLVAIGAILTFAVTANTSVFNLHIAGVVFMLTGLAGLLIPRRTYASLNRRLIRRRTRSWPNGRILETRQTSYPPYVVTNPGAAAEPAELLTEPGTPPDPRLQPDWTEEDAEPEPGLDGATSQDETIDLLRDE